MTSKVNRILKAGYKIFFQREINPYYPMDLQFSSRCAKTNELLSTGISGLMPARGEHGINGAHGSLGRAIEEMQYNDVLWDAMNIAYRRAPSIFNIPRSAELKEWLKEGNRVTCLYDKHEDKVAAIFLRKIESGFAVHRIFTGDTFNRVFETINLES